MRAQRLLPKTKAPAMFVVAFMAVATLTFSQAQDQGQVRVRTDKPDYLPGETVTITGKGWHPGESVRILLRENPQTHPDRVFTSVADGSGFFENKSFSPESHDEGVLFTVIATGQTSASTAETTFTDSHAVRHGGTSRYLISTSTGTSIVPGVTNLGVNCDDCGSFISLPFPYHLYDQTFSSIYISSNGVAQFVGGNAAFSNSCLPNGFFSYAIFVHWDDLWTADPGQGVFTSISGTAPHRIFNIEWRASFFYDRNAFVNFELRLYEGQSRFDIIYGRVDYSGGSATVGVQESTGTSFSEYQCNGGELFAGLMLTFSHVPAPSISAIAPDVVQAGRGSFTLTVEGSNFDSGAVVQVSQANQGSIVTITFDRFGTSFPISYREAGVTVTSLQDHLHLADHDGDGSIDLLNHAFCCSTPYVFDFNAGGAVFSVISFDVVSIAAGRHVFTSSSGATLEVSTAGRVTFPLEGWTNITSFRWDENSSHMAIDNLVLVLGGSGSYATVSTNFVSSSRLTATVPASHIASTGTLGVRVLSPEGLSSQAKLLSVKQQLLYFPLVAKDDNVYTGMALANVSDSPVAPSLEGFTDSGEATNPISPLPVELLNVVAKNQVAKLTSEVFPVTTSGWFRVSHSDPGGQLKGFFLHGRLDLTTIDGSDVDDRISTDLVFPIVSATDSGESQVVLVNPNLIDALLTLELFGPLGSNEPHAAKKLKKENFTLAKLSRLEKTASELLDGADIATLFGSDSTGGQLYLRVKSDLGLFGFQTLPERTSTSDFVALRGQDVATESGNELFFAHLAEGSGFETVLSLINLKTPAVSASVDVKIVLDNGITETVNRILPPGGVLRTKLRDLFSVLSGNTVAVGYIRATSKDATLDSGPVTAGPMMGSITFQHALQGATAALPGQSSPSAQLTFSHVAVQDVNVTNDAWLTGIALLNPSTTDDAIVKIMVRKPDGTEAGVRDNFLLRAGERKSRLLVELVREVKNQAGGYIVVESKKADGSNLPIYGFELFGDWFLKKLAAVPAQ